MVLRKVLSLCLVVLYAGILIVNQVESCNEVVCASIVSKCMLTQSCKCEPKNCSCYKECLSCLGKKYYEECCSCVELCPKPNETRNALSKKSHVEEFDGVPELFNALITSDTEEYEWDIVTFPVDFDTVLAGPKLEKDVKYYLKSNEHDSDELIKERDHTITVNCSVIYLSQCISWNKCRQSCQSTGASSYRWFHDGCCECVGATCINYGINDSRCRRCPETKDEGEEAEEIDDELQDFGDEMGPFDGTVNNQFL